MNPFQAASAFISELLYESLSAVSGSWALIGFCLMSFLAGMLLGYICAWYKYFWKHFMDRG